MASVLPSANSCRDPGEVPAFGTWRKDSERASAPSPDDPDDPPIPDAALEGLSYAFQQARLARVVSRKEESAQRPVPAAEASKAVPAFGAWLKDEEHTPAGSGASAARGEGAAPGPSSGEGLSYAFQQARAAKVVFRSSLGPRTSGGSSRRVESLPHAEASPSGQGTPRFGDWDKGGGEHEEGLGSDPTFSDDFAQLVSAKKKAMARGKKVPRSPQRTEFLPSPPRGTLSPHCWGAGADSAEGTHRLAAAASEGAELWVQRGEGWSIPVSPQRTTAAGAGEAGPPSPAALQAASSARESPLQQPWQERLAEGSVSHTGSATSIPLRGGPDVKVFSGPWDEAVSSSVPSEGGFPSAMSIDARDTMAGPAAAVPRPEPLAGQLPPSPGSASRPPTKETGQPLPEGPGGTTPRGEASSECDEQIGCSSPRAPSHGRCSPAAGGSSPRHPGSGPSLGSLVRARLEGEQGPAGWQSEGENGTPGTPEPRGAQDPKGSGKAPKSRAGTGGQQDKVLYGNTAAALANSSSPWEAAILQQKLAVRIAARKAERSAAAGTPPVRRPAMLEELDRALAEARKGLILAREGSLRAGEDGEGEQAAGGGTPRAAGRDAAAPQKARPDPETPGRGGGLGEASPSLRHERTASPSTPRLSPSPSPRQGKPGKGEFRSPSTPAMGGAKHVYGAPLRKSSSEDNSSSSKAVGKKPAAPAQAVAPPRRGLIRSITEGASARGGEKEGAGEPWLSAAPGSSGSSSTLASVAEEDSGGPGSAIRRSSSNQSPLSKGKGMGLLRSASAAPGKVGTSSARHRLGTGGRSESGGKHDRSSSLESHPTPLLASLDASGSMRRHLFAGLGGGEPRTAAPPPVVDLTARGRVLMAAGIAPASAAGAGAPESPLRLPSIPGSPLSRSKSSWHSPLPRGKSAPGGAKEAEASRGSPPPPLNLDMNAGCLLPSKSGKDKDTPAGRTPPRTPGAAARKGGAPKGPALPGASSVPPTRAAKGQPRVGLPRGRSDGSTRERSASIAGGAAQRKGSEEKQKEKEKEKEREKEKEKEEEEEERGKGKGKGKKKGNGDLPRMCSEQSDGSGSSDSMAFQETGPRGRAKTAKGNCLVQ